MDAILGAPDSVWEGAQVRTAADDHVAHGGFARTRDRRHLLLPVLQEVQSAIGWVSHGALNYVSERIPVSPAEAYGVADFYELIALEPRPARVAHVCDDVACRVAGVESELELLGTHFGAEGTVVGDAMWLRSPCLGQCEKGSAAFIQVAGASDVVIAPARADTLVEALASDEPPASLVAPGSPLAPEVPTVADLAAYIDGGGYRALSAAIEMGRSAVVDEVDASRIRGRGGAAFPAGVKWRAVASAEGPAFVVCNADESEPGTFKDRVLMEANPFGLVEAMTIAGWAVGAARGYLYVRGEYPIARSRVEAAIAAARAEGLLGTGIAGSGFDFDIDVRSGAGAYICGEETALFNSIEGFRGEPRQKPPFPTDAGLFGRPTLVNNVETLMNVPRIVLDGGAAFASVGTAESTGTKLFCVSGRVRAPGVYDVPFGSTTNDLLALAGGVDGDLAAVLVGGAAGTFIAGDDLDVPLTFEGSRSAGIALGSGVVMAITTDVDLASITRRIAHFFAEESCGLCVPCRVGTVRQEEALGRMSDPGDHSAELALLSELDGVLRDASICGLGQFATSAVQSAIRIGLIGGAP